MQLVLVLGLFAACGGDEPTRDDAVTMRVMFQSAADVQLAAQPLSLCLPKQTPCYRAAGPDIVKTVEGARTDVDEALAETDDECLKKVASAYRRMLDVYAEAGRAATAGDTAGADDALLELTDLAAAYSKQVGTCGFTQGPDAELTATLRAVQIDLYRLDDEMFQCADAPCALEVSERMEAKAREGQSILAGLVARLRADSEAPLCAPDALAELQEFFRAIELMNRALQRGGLDAVERQATRANQLQVEASQDMAACIGRS